ncbi:hypothetical protein Ddye_011213 [Dipteronia dyeriana]|uniref:RanBD1 domain-containing protein n=1 Tax=Dipteronia dyeriana TaxID=168575 RepID=A0AAD9UBZ2_9ROSI|nr:hypothetical protein Ddye_011213 [Dipteronia dyeriana]
MGDAENTLPPSKKRAAGREISRDNPGLDDDEDSSELETGTFKKASEEVLAGRRIVKVRRAQTTSTPTSNPFAGIRLVPSASAEPSVKVTTEAVASSEKEDAEGSKNDACKKTEMGENENNKQSESKVDEPAAETVVSKEADEDEDKSSKQSESKTDEAASGAVADKQSEKDLEKSAIVIEAAKDEVDSDKAAGVDKTESEDKKDNSHENADSSADGSSLNSFQQLSSSQNAFTGLAGTGFSNTTFSFGSLKEGSALGSSSGSLFGLKSDQPSFGFGLSNNGNSSLLKAAGASIISKSEGAGFPSMQEVVVETGEENETVVFTADSVLFEYLDESWKERGKGEIKVNISTSAAGRARLLMRTRGNYRLILNASLYPDMKLTNMEKKGITFACINSASEVKEGLSTFALKFKDGSVVDEFRAAVLAHKDKTATVLKTPENSPKASDD